jgi:hypothetical protein
VDVEVRTVPDETAELRADGLGSGELLPELLEHAAAPIPAAISITVLNRIGILPGSSLDSGDFRGHYDSDGARGVPVTERKRECLLAGLQVEGGRAINCR